MLRPFFADLHIHIGRTEHGEPVKITGAKNLTLFAIAEEASAKKGLDMIGIIDCHSPVVQAEITRYLELGTMKELADGGIQYQNTTILLGCEVEVRDEGLGPAHLLAYMPDLMTMRLFTRWMSRYVKNINLSSQRIYVSARELQEKVIELGGLLIPAHVFTPHRSLYGSSSTSIAHLLNPDHIAALELGLSADSEMASWISETDRYTFVTNSDAHSLGKIGREYNVIMLAKPTYTEVKKALALEEGRYVMANYGLNPRLGKYHRSFCTQCRSILDEEQKLTDRCLYCGHAAIVRGVMDRIMEIADRTSSKIPPARPPYYYQVPLEFIPGLGAKSIGKLLQDFGTEMNILHHVSYEQLAEAAGNTIADMIIAAREGKLNVATGGGGIYGKITAAD